MASPKYSAPDLTPEQIARTREGKPPWPRNRDIRFDLPESSEQPPAPK